MIPRKIHYCWFGKGQMPKRLADCIKTWELVMPDYQIVRWDETNCDIESILFTAEAYAAKKWAFVSDYFRLLALYTEGGIYFDTDVIAVKRFDDFLENDFFSGIYYHSYVIKRSNSLSLLNEDGTLKDGYTSCLGLSIMTPMMGSIPGHIFIKDWMEHYNNKHFILPDGTFDMTPNNDICSKIATKYGFRYKNVLQKLGNNMTFYPSSVLAGEGNEFTKESYALHSYEGSWIGNWYQRLPVILSRNNLVRILVGRKPMITPNTVIKKYKGKKAASRQ